MKFISDRSPADLISTFENQWLESRFGQVKRGDQPVVPAADDDNVAPAGVGLGHVMPLP